MVNPNIKFTVRDYMNLPESEEKRYELIAGELYMVPSPNPFHQKITGNLFRILSDFVEAHNLGLVFIAPLDVVLFNKVQSLSICSGVRARAASASLSYKEAMRRLSGVSGVSESPLRTSESMVCPVVFVRRVRSGG